MSNEIIAMNEDNGFTSVLSSIQPKDRASLFELKKQKRKRVFIQIWVSR